MRAIVTLPFATLLLLSPAAAQTIYPYDRADILAASPLTVIATASAFCRPGNSSSARTARTSRR